MDINRYAQRLLNPFRGVMNVVEYQGAEAVTTDGVQWDIYVRDTDLVRELANSSKVQTSDIRYGSWSIKEGLKRGAIFPSEDFRLLEHRGAIVYEHLLRNHQAVPFPLKDHFELWLLDTRSRPLGLLDSAVNEDDIELDCPIDWRAGQACRRRFHPAVLRELLAEEDEAVGAAEYLTRHINSRAGTAPQAQWFRRRPDGSGEGLDGIRLAGHLPGRILGKAAFPACFLQNDDGTAPQRQLIQDFLAWQAPWLLLLQDLSPATRTYFERHARSRALTVEKLYRLYPEILDEDALTVARVEAALRKNQPRDDEPDETMSTYYIELNVTRTN